MPVPPNASQDLSAHAGISGASAMADPRAYLQQRVTLYAKTLFWFFTGAITIDAAGFWVVPVEGGVFFSMTRFVTFGLVVAFWVFWRFVRAGERRQLTLSVLEAAVTIVTATTLASLAFDDQGIIGGKHFAVIVAMLMVMALLMVRAAVVPSTAFRTLAIGLVCAVPMGATAALAWDAPSPLEEWTMPMIGRTLGGMSVVTYAIVSAIISHIIFGLQAKVRAALQLGQYTLEEKIGEGGMGSVYKARHALLRRPTAIKLLPPHKAGEQAIARFQREVQETSRLTHPNTVAIFDFGHTPDGVFYYAMEYLEGVALDDLVEIAGPQPAGRVIHILAQAAEALAEAHQKGLIHRDVKPANIVLCERGGIDDVVKVVDFGLVKDVSTTGDVQLSTTAAITGTPLYIAPESLIDPSTIDGRTDIYALGGVAYFLLTGESVFDGKSIVEVCGHHLHTDPIPPSERLGEPIDEDLENIVMSCLAKEPDDRPADALALRDAMQACGAAGSWTHGDAAAWWKERGAVIAEQREKHKGDLSDKVPESALTVALRERGDQVGAA
ncbi:MAG: serine/threonine protein kinase [Deltaproteobacteria bacterium]|nr:serine/threonine protein kinase [Deltaproteobacteria bacterium]